ncbi:hypothetical protein PTKU46_37040 [Paraburkholderia terrae]
MQHHGGFEPSLVELEAISNAEYWGATEAFACVGQGALSGSPEALGANQVTLVSTSGPHLLAAIERLTERRAEATQVTGRPFMLWKIT